MEINANKTTAETSNEKPDMIPTIQNRMKLVVNYCEMEIRSKCVINTINLHLV